MGPDGTHFFRRLRGAAPFCLTICGGAAIGASSLFSRVSYVMLAHEPAGGYMMCSRCSELRRHSDHGRCRCACGESLSSAASYPTRNDPGVDAEMTEVSLSPLAYFRSAHGVLRRSVVIAAAGFALTVSGCVSEQNDFAMGARLGDSSSVPSVGQLDPSDSFLARFVGSERSHYKIGPTDVLKVTVFQVESLDRKVQVSGRGTITLPLIGEVRAAGRSAQEVEEEVAARLKSRYLTAPQVTVFIDEYNSQKITVSGAVKKAGIFPVKGDLSLLQAISAAEGLDTIADQSNVVIFREEGGKRFVAKFSLDQIRTGAARDPLLQNGDVVVVDSSSYRTALRDWAPALSGLGSTATFISVLK